MNNTTNTAVATTTTVNINDRIENRLMQFVRDNHGDPRGIVVAQSIDDKIHIGWSFVNKKSGDKFNKERGLQIAIGRIEKNTNSVIPRDVNVVVDIIANRSRAYFKKDDVIVSGCVI